MEFMYDGGVGGDAQFSLVLVVVVVLIIREITARCRCVELELFREMSKLHVDG